MRLQAPLVRLRPYLKKVHLILVVAIVLRVSNPRPCTRELYFAALEVLQVAHTVTVFEGAVDNVAEDEELGVRVRAEARGGLDAVFVDDTERAPRLVARVVVRGEGEGMEAV